MNDNDKNILLQESVHAEGKNRTKATKAKSLTLTMVNDDDSNKPSWWGNKQKAQNKQNKEGNEQIKQMKWTKLQTIQIVKQLVITMIQLATTMIQSAITTI